MPKAQRKFIYCKKGDSCLLKQFFTIENTSQDLPVFSQNQRQPWNNYPGTSGFLYLLAKLNIDIQLIHFFKMLEWASNKITLNSHDLTKTSAFLRWQNLLDTGLVAFILYQRSFLSNLFKLAIQFSNFFSSRIKETDTRWQ